MPLKLTKKFNINNIKKPIIINLLMVTIVLFLISGSVTKGVAHTKPGPHFEIEVDSSKNKIWPKGAGKKPDTTQVNLSFEATGEKALIFNPQDTMFVVDSSHSMRENDANQTIISSTKNYVNNMVSPDRAGIIKMASNGSIIQGLTDDYERLKNDLELTIEPGGRTNFQESIDTATTELIDKGDPSKERIEILLTDGKATNNITQNSLNKVVENEIKIYPIGFGEDVDSTPLRWMANRTGGTYYNIQNTTELTEVYENISNREYTDKTARDMELKIEFNDYIDVDPYSFTKEPNSITNSDGKTIPKWDFNKTFVLGDEWNVRFNISTNKKGRQSIYTNESGLYYIQPWDNQSNFNPLPNFVIEGNVKNLYLPPPPPPPPAGTTPAPVEAFPMPTSPMSTATVVPQASLQPVAQTAGYQGLFAPLLGLGLGEALKGKSKVEQKDGISMKSGQNPDQEEEKEEVKSLGYTHNER